MSKYFKRIFSIKNLPILLILLLAGFLRIYRIDEFLTFLGDEGRDVLVVKHILNGFGALFSGNFAGASEGLTLLGPTASVGGFFLGPIYYYFMAPFLLLFNYNPVGPAIMVGLVGVATVLLLYVVAKDFFSYTAALCVALLYAVSPLVIQYSRSSWNPNVVPFFALLMMYVLYKAVVKNSWRLFMLAGFLFGILIQLHYLATFLGVAAAIYIIITSVIHQKIKIVAGKQIVLRYIFFGVGVIAGWIPFLLFEIRHGFPNLRSIFEFITASGDTGGNEKYFMIVNDVLFRLYGRLIFAFPRVEDLKLYPEKLLEVWGLGVFVIAICSIIYIFYMLYKSLKQDKKACYKYTLLLVWMFTIVFLFGFYKKPIYDYYLVIAYPLPFLFLAGLISYLAEKGRMVAGVLFLLIGGIAILNLSYNSFRTQGNHQLNQVKTIAEFVMDKTDGKPYNFAVISGGGNSDHAYRYFFEVNNMEPVTIQFPGVDPERKTVTDQLLIVCESNPCAPLGYPLWEVAGFGQAEIVGEWPVSVLKVYKLKHYNP